jgi:hypothetical protein
MKIRSKDSLYRTHTSRNRATIAAAAFAGLSIVSAVHADIANFTQAGAGPTDWTLNGNTEATAAGVPNMSAGVLNLTTAANSEASSAWFNTPQSVTNFTANFTYNFLGGTVNPADGFAFVLQNSGLTALGGGGGALGYLGINNSVALAGDVWNANTAGTVTNTAYSASGYPGINNYAPTTPVSLRDTVTPVNFSIAYSNGVFRETLTQGANSFTRNSFYDVASRVGPTGFIGFTGGTGGANAGQRITNFSYTVGTAAPPAFTPGPILTGVPVGGPGVFGIREVLGAAGCCGDLTQAQAAVLANAGTSHIDYTAPVLNLYDSDVRGSFTGDSLYKLDPDQVTPDNDTVNNIAVIATSRVRIPTTGMWTFGSNSDDGFRLTIGGRGFEAGLGQGGTTVNNNGSLEFPAGRGGATPSLGTIFLPAGDYDIQMLNWEGGGGASVELYASPGLKTAFDPGTFNLVGGAAIAGTTGKNKVLGVGSWTYKSYTNAANVTEVINAGRGQASPAVLNTTTTETTIHFHDPQGSNTGSHGGDAATFPGDTAADDNAFGGYATASLTLAAADVGRYTFMLYTDDDSRFRISLGGVPVPLVGTTTGDVFDSDGVNGNDQFGTNGCCFDQFGHYDLNTAGVYTIEAAFHEGGGGAGFFIYGTQGDRNTFDPAAFQLLGANFDGPTWNTNVAAGLQLVPEPGSISLLGLAAVGLMARRRRLQA